MHDRIKSNRLFKRISKTMFYSRIRGLFNGPGSYLSYIDDSKQIDDDITPINITWPTDRKKPHVGVVRDVGSSPRWTKYIRFLKNNDIPFSFYNIHSSHWLEEANQFDVVIGYVSSSGYHLDEMKRKFYMLERHLGISCYPNFATIMLYEDKIIELYLSNIYGFPFAKTFITHDYEEAMSKLSELQFPLVSKVVPGSGSVGVELVHNAAYGRRIIRRAFSSAGRKTHVGYLRQKNYVYFQDYIPNDGYDIRVMVINKMVFGYYRKALEGDFRASGMGIVEKRSLPIEAIHIARSVYNKLNIPMIVVDMVFGKDGKYYIIELSPICRIDTPEQLHVNNVSGVYLFDDEHTYRFVEGRFWIDELALQNFFKSIVKRKWARIETNSGRQAMRDEFAATGMIHRTY